MIRPEILCITLILKKIKKIFVVLSAALLLGTVSANAQSLKELFSNGGVKSVVESVVDQLDVIPKNIEGNWTFSGSAVKFTGDNMLMNAASELAVGKVEDTLNEYLAKVGIKEGLFSYTFNEDGTFSTSFNQAKFPGQYTFSQQEKTLELDYGKNEKLKGIALKTNVSVGTSTMQLLFNADKLLEFISKITSSVGDSKLGALTSLLDQYDGMRIGFELTCVK